MKLAHQKVVCSLNNEPTVESICNNIALAASTCYKSEPKTGEEAAKFVNKLIENCHFAMLEFGTVYLTAHCAGSPEASELYHFYSKNPYSKVTIMYYGNPNYISGEIYITTNYRVIVENHRQDDLQYLTEPSVHERRYGVKLITSIAVARELTRHRTMSFAQESTRYCNYSKDKFEKELTYIVPTWMDKLEEFDESYGIPYSVETAINPPKTGEFYKYYRYFIGLKEAEKAYMTLCKHLPAQQARDLLPLATKTEICMMGFESDWKHFMHLRLEGLTGEPHPDMKALAIEIDNILNIKTKAYDNSRVE